MIIVCTQDPAVIANQNGAPYWGAFNVVPTDQQGQEPDNAQFAQWIGALGVGEALALSAHGSNTELGNAAAGSWTWTVEAIAALLSDAPNGYTGPILIHACATDIVNFSANLAQALRNNGILAHWIYGYNRAVGTNEDYPDPTELDKIVALQGTKV